VVGGKDGNEISSVELFPPSDACSIPDLPQPRQGHSLSLLSGGRLVVCGGYRYGYHDSCNSWVAGNTSWTPFHTMSVARDWHTAWTPSSLPDSIVLLGGYGGSWGSASLTAEMVPGERSFNLSHSGYLSCGIPDAGDTIVLTGGYSHKYVTRYDVNGFVEELPELPERRHGHACGALPATGVRPAQTPFAGIDCGRRRDIRPDLHFFCAGSPPWSRRLDSRCLPAKTIERSSSFDCGRQAQGDWGS